MIMQKKVIGNLKKCYSLSLLDYQNKMHMLVASEDVDQCRMYDMNGNLEEIIWDGFGGTMSLVPVPGGEGQFLAIQGFYSPDDSGEAAIVSVTPNGRRWKIRTLVNLPFVHRFDILHSGEKNYLIACTLKSDHAYEGDWSAPGKVYGAELPKDLTVFDENHPLPLQVLKEQVLRNHGYFCDTDGSGEAGVIACEHGVFCFHPPGSSDPQATGTGELVQGWRIESLLDVPASDVILIDLDGCGEKEMLIFSPFHGSKVLIYKKLGGAYQLAYEHPEHLEFLHAICAGELNGKPAAFIGNRRGRMELSAVTADGNRGFSFQTLDSGCGSANVLFYQNANQKALFSANRETDEIAWYMFEN